MSVKRRDLVQYLEDNGFYLLREGANHFIYTNGSNTFPSSGTGSSTVSPPTRSASRRADTQVLRLGLQLALALPARSWRST